MSATSTLSHEIAQCNNQLDCALKERFGVSFRTYKAILALARLGAVIVLGAALVEGANTELVIIALALIVAGPDAAEMIVSAGSNGNDDKKP